MKSALSWSKSRSGRPWRVFPEMNSADGQLWAGESIDACTSASTTTMACSSSTRNCRRALSPLLNTSNATRSATTTLPAFLVPAFAPSTNSQQTSNFSTTQQCRSKIGRAVLSLPPEVSLTISEAVAQKQGKISRGQQGSVVKIDGPLGNMSLTIPPYMSINPDETGRNFNLQILDAEERRQREMWGMF